MKRTWRSFAAILLASVLVLAACGSDDDAATATGADGGASGTENGGGGSDETINIVGFAVPEAANKAIQDEWAKTPAGAGVTWLTSYGASGDQSRDDHRARRVPAAETVDHTRRRGL